MSPRLLLVPRSVTELALVAITALLAIAAALRARTSASDETSRLVATFVAYFAGGAALVLLSHAALGHAVFAVSSYAALLLTGAFVAWSILIRRLPRIGVPRSSVIAILIGVLLSGLLGGKIAEIAGNVATGHSTDGVRGGTGFGVFGALAGGFVCIWTLSRIDSLRIPLASTLDAGASAVFANVAIARLGCLLAGCCFGAPTDAAFPLSLLSLPVTLFAADSPAGAFAAHDTSVRSLWATQPMEAIVAAVIAIGAEVLWRRRATFRVTQRVGSIAALSALAYAAARAGLEAIRADSDHIARGLTIWSFAAFALAVAAVSFLLAGAFGRHESALSSEPSRSPPMDLR